MLIMDNLILFYLGKTGKITELFKDFTNREKKIEILPNQPNKCDRIKEKYSISVEINVDLDKKSFPLFRLCSPV